MVGICGGCLIAFILLLVLAGALYRKTHDIGLLGQCIFTDSGCSVAAGTWVLVGGTLGAFTAAAMAAIFAAGVYDVEVKPQLGLDRCLDPRHENVAERFIICGPNREVSHQKIDDLDSSKYFQTNFEFVNLGRTTLVGVTLQGKASLKGDDDPVNLSVDLGNVRPDHPVHLQTFFWRDLGQPTIRWDEKAVRQSNGTSIEFHPAHEPAKGRVRLPLQPPESEDISVLRSEIDDLRKLIAERLPAPPEADTNN